MLTNITKHAKGMLNIIIIHLVDHFLRSQLFYLLAEVRSDVSFVSQSRTVQNSVVRMHQYSDILNHILSVVL